MRLIDTPGTPVVDAAGAARIMKCCIPHAQQMMSKWRLETRRARPGEILTQAKQVYLRREVEQLAALRRQYNNHIPKRLWPSTPYTESRNS